MKFAYLIQAHKNPSQLCDLINVLQDEDNYFFVHIDEKSELSLFLRENYKMPERIFFLERRISVNWAGFSQVKATMCLIQALIETGIQVDYVHLLSGQDFPLKSNVEIDNYFVRNNGLNFIEFFPLPYKNWSGNGGLDRLTYKWLIDETGIERAYFLVEYQKQKNMKRNCPLGIKFYGGSQWWSLTYECVSFLANNCAFGNELYDFYKNTLCPDEMIFQTILQNSIFQPSLVNSNLRYIDWVKGPEYPRLLRIDDLSLLLKSECLFARKFDDVVDSEIRSVLKNQIMGFL